MLLSWPTIFFKTALINTLLVVIPELINCFLPKDKVVDFVWEVDFALPTNHTANSVVVVATVFSEVVTVVVGSTIVTVSFFYWP